MMKTGDLRVARFVFIPVPSHSSPLPGLVIVSLSFAFLFRRDSLYAERHIYYAAIYIALAAIELTTPYRPDKEP